MKRIIVYLFVCFCPFAATAQISSTNQKNDIDKTDIEDIIIVFKMHFDIGYTDWSEAVLQKYSGNMLNTALDAVIQTSSLPEEDRFVWTLPGWPMKYMLENSPQAAASAARQALADRRFAVHALPFTFETESSDLETLVRSMGYSSGICRSLGLELPRGAKLTDVPSHSWALPTILSNAGVQILHIGCNSGSASPDVPTVFWWEGPDGSRLLTVNWAEYYGSGVMPPENWPYKTWLAMIHTHENTGAPTPEDVEKVLAEAREKAPNARIKIGTLEDFHDALMSESPEIPVVRGDMPDTWIHGYMSMPDAVRINKSLQRKIWQTEALDKSLECWGYPQGDCTPYVENALEQSLLFDEHTFGLAMSHGRQAGWEYGDDFIIERAKGNYDFIEESWFEKGLRPHRALHNIMPVQRRNMAMLVRSAGTDGKRVTVYNQLPYKRSGTVSFPMEVYLKDFTVTGLEDTSTGDTVAVEDRHNILRFNASDVPAMGYKTYKVITGECLSSEKCSLFADEQDRTLENKFFRVRIDADNGALVSVYDKTNKCEMAGEKSGYGFGEYIHERFGQDEISRYNESYVKPGNHGWADREMGRPDDKQLEYSCARGKVSHIAWEKSDVAVSAYVFCSMPQPDETGNIHDRSSSEEYMMTYTLYADSPYLEISWYPVSSALSPQPESGWLAFPFNVKKPEFHLGRLGAIVNPTRDFVKRTNTDYCFLNTGLALTDRSGNGFGLNSPTAPAVSLGRPGLYRFSKDYVPNKPDVFVNLYNTQWGTNFTEWITDKSSVKIKIWSVSGYDNAESLIAPVEDTRSPMIAAYYDGPKGNMPVSASGLSVSEKNVLVTAYGDNPDGDGTLLRLWEQGGTQCRCTVNLPSGVYKSWELCNLRGEELQGIQPVCGDSITVEMKAYAPRSILLYK